MATLDVWIDGLEPALSVRRFEVREGVSELFTLSLVACSPRADLDLDDLVLRPASFLITSGWASVRNGGSRFYTGLCSSIEQLKAESTGLSTYRVILAPRLALMTLRESYRIFQHATIPDIATRLLDEFAIAHEWRINRSAFPKLNYKVQYGENDFAFLCRLCEEGGITFLFEDDEERGSLLVLSDAPGAARPRSGAPLAYVDNPNEAAEKEFITRVNQRREARSGTVVLRDYDFRNPSFPLLAEARSATPAEALLSQHRYEPGAFRVVRDASSATPVADTGGVACHEQSYGRELANRLLFGARASSLAVAFETNAMDLAPGTVFSIAGHPHPKLDESRKLLVTQLAIEGEHDKEWRTQGSAVFADAPYWPPRRTKKPVVHGLQSAIVTGPKEREIFTDEYGRVRVQFPWDREGRGDDRSSCWIRVSQGWAGAGFGLWTVPRVGQEVLVGFLAGDPDEPIIVGRAPNAHNPPPYPLPGHETKTVWRSRSTPRGDGFNEISFEDRKGEELLYERAEKDKESLIKSDERIVVGRDRRKLVKSDEDVAILGTRRELVGGDRHLTIKGERREQVDGSQSFAAGGDRNERVGGRYAIEVGGELHIIAGGPIVLEAPDVTLKAPGGFVRVNGGGVVIDGGAVVIKQGGSPGNGGACEPNEPEPPTMFAGFVSTPPKALRRLPLMAFGRAAPFNIRPDAEMVTICVWICECDSYRDAGRRKSQHCLTKKVRAHDAALGGQSTIKAEVPYDMSTSPPAPIMSKNHPGPTTGSPKGSRIPDIVLLHDGLKPPVQGNIRKVIEVKFGADQYNEGHDIAFMQIAGGAPVETWRPGDPCLCPKEPEPRKVKAEEVAVVLLLALAIAAVIADDALPGGQADDPALVPLITKLLEQLAKLRAAFPAPMAPLPIP